MLTALALAAAVVTAPPIQSGMQLTYTGTLSPMKADGTPATKKFEASFLFLQDADELGWVLSESGRGGWTWRDRFGRMPASERRSENSSGPALLYVREDGRSIVPLPGPLFVSPLDKLERGATWSDQRLEYRVNGQATKSERVCWEIEARSPYGHKRTLWVEQGSSLVVALRETVFMGQGQEHRLTMELSATKMMAADDLATATAAVDAWSKLRGQLGWQSRDLRTELTTEQIATLKSELPKLTQPRGGNVSFLSEIVAAAQQDSQGQRNRAGAIAALRDAAIGQPLGELKLTELGGKAVTNADFAGKVVVLHFWEYRDSPLEEPYGQTGYLDYLLRRRTATDVAVYGVHVDPRLSDDTGRSGSIAAARRLKAFMNLSYAILLDDGALLKRLGDPRPAGSKLPLFVVIDKDGKIAEFHAGMYDVKANEGLTELEAAVRRALEMAR
jgi:peroxiredoxin